jgi:hypothetical protein
MTGAVSAAAAISQLAHLLLGMEAERRGEKETTNSKTKS